MSLSALLFSSGSPFSTWGCGGTQWPPVRSVVLQHQRKPKLCGVKLAYHQSNCITDWEKCQAADNMFKREVGWFFIFFLITYFSQTYQAYRWRKSSSKATYRVTSADPLYLQIQTASRLNLKTVSELSGLLQACSLLAASFSPAVTLHGIIPELVYAFSYIHFLATVYMPRSFVKKTRIIVQHAHGIVSTDNLIARLKVVLKAGTLWLQAGW